MINLHVRYPQHTHTLLLVYFYKETLQPNYYTKLDRR